MHCFVTRAGPLGWPSWERLAPPSVSVAPLEMCRRSSSVVHISVQWSCSLDQNGRVTFSAGFTEIPLRGEPRMVSLCHGQWGEGARVVWPSSFPLPPHLHPHLPPNSGLSAPRRTGSYVFRGRFRTQNLVVKSWYFISITSILWSKVTSQVSRA